MKATTLGSVLLAGCCLVAPVRADKESHDQAVEIANAFADCSAFWLYMSEFATGQGKPSVAEGMKNMANGAQTTAIYFLAQEWTQAHPDERRTYGSFLPQITGRIDTSLVRFRGMDEMEDVEGISQQGKICQGLTHIQEETLQSIRNASARNSAPSN